MKKLKSAFTVLCLAFMVAGIYVSASGQTLESRNKRAVLSASSGGVRWDAGATNGGTLTVSTPDGRIFRKQFQAGGSPEFSSIDDRGERLPDGQYTFELRFAPASSGGMLKPAARPKDDEPEAQRAARKLSVEPEDLSQSGTFTILNGAVVVPGAVEPQRPVSKTTGQQKALQVISANTLNRLRNHRLAIAPMFDIVHADDVIIQGSACVGFDCMNGESFGFDTIRLKENNTRIKFEDTSNTASFPSNDWQLTANDSANGGANKFSIDDITNGKTPFTITGNAPSSSIFVDSSGRLGLGTATPVVGIHRAEGNTPTLRLEQNGSSGFTPQTWDVAGNEANFFIRDVTGGSRLPFRIRPGAPTSSIDIAASGNVGIGTQSPSQLMHLKKDQNTNTILLVNNGTAGSGAQADVRVQNDGGTLGQLGIYSSTTSAYGAAGPSDVHVYSSSSLALMADNASGIIKFAAGGNAEKMRLLANGRLGIGTNAPDQLLSVNGDASKTGANTWLAFSDERLKNIKGNFNSGLKAVMQLQPIRYEYKPDNALGLKSEGEHIGFGAQTLQKIIPEAVIKNSAGYLMVNADPILWTMLNAIKEQQKEIADLKAQVRKLQTSHRTSRKK